MVDEIKKNLQSLISKVPGLYSVILSDRDGVPVLYLNTERAPELAMKPAFEFLSTFGLAIDQGSKLGLGKTKTLICNYSHYQIVQLNKLPLIVSFIANENCNTGHILALEKEMDPIISILSLTVTET